jgi:ketosteroid isomerase-like protein
MESTANELVQLVYDRSEIAQTLYRYASGLDHNNAETFASVFTDDCVLDFTPAGEKLEIAFPVLHGRDEIVGAVLPIIGPLDTTHTVSNVQMEVRGDAATMCAFILAQHYMPGDGPKRGTEYAMLMNRYEAELVRSGRQWLFTRVMIDNVWAEGDPGLLTALATYRAVRGRAKQRQS